MEVSKKTAEERFMRDLLNENNQLHKDLRKMSALMSELDEPEFTDMEVRHGTVVFIGCR